MGGKYSSPVSALPADRTFIVTGANSGMGYYMAKALAQLGGRVIVACRSEERATKAIEQMNKEHQEELSNQNTKSTATTEKSKSDTGATGDETKPDSEQADAAPTGGDGESGKVQPLNLEFMKLDLCSLASVMDFIKSFKAKGYPLHTLVCNAGIGTTKELELTEDDNEKQFQVNYLGQHLILLHLLPLIKESGPNSRVIFVTGGAFTFKMASFRPDDLQLKKSFSNTKIVGNTKLFQTMSMYAFERRTKGSGIGWFAVNPGVVNTPMVKQGDSRALSFAFNSLEKVRLAKSSQQGAEVMLKAILDPVYDGREALFFDHKCASNSHNPGSLAKNVEKQEVLWKLSLELLKDYVTDDLMKDLQLPADEGGEGAKAEGAKEGGGEEMKGEEKTKSTEETKGTDDPKQEEDAGGAAAN